MEHPFEPDLSLFSMIPSKKRMPTDLACVWQDTSTNGTRTDSLSEVGRVKTGYEELRALRLTTISQKIPPWNLPSKWNLAPMPYDNTATC